MAHMKYLHFAGIARAKGHPEVAKVFEDTAAQEIKHALAHAELIYPAQLVDTAKALELAIEGETYEYTEMYPGFRLEAEKEGNLRPSGNWKSRSRNRRNMRICSAPPWPRRPSASRPWPASRKSTPIIIAKRWST